MYGDIQLPTPYQINEKYLILKCNDHYENLCEKTIYLCKTITYIFPEIKGMIKCDDDIFPNIKKLNELITLVSMNDIHYLGTVVNPSQFNSIFHYNKRSSTSYTLSKQIQPIEYISGPIYYVNNYSMNLLWKTNVDNYSFEDVMVGHILHEHNIKPYNYKVYSDHIHEIDSYCIHNCNNYNYIYVFICGGLGNQLFQIFNAYRLAKEHNRFVVVVIKQQFKQVMAHNTIYNEYMNTIFSSFNYMYFENVDISNLVIYNEQKCFDYNPNIIQENKNYLLNGYFQHKKYINPELLSIFKQHDICMSLKQMYPLLSESYFIHFRLGDYITNQYLSTYYFDKDSYYSKAIEYILNIHTNAHFYILSDDIEFIKTYPILKNINKTIIDLDTVRSLYFMSLCNLGGICANSTFSGWGATLNENKNKIIICPKQWINISYDYEIPFYSTITL
jgi:hypothetical protein